MIRVNKELCRMVLSIYDLDDFAFYMDVIPLRKMVSTVAQSAGGPSTGGVLSYDYVLRGRRLGIGPDFLQDEAAAASGGGQAAAAGAVSAPRCELDVRGKIRCAELFMVSDATQKTDIESVTPAACLKTLRAIDVHRYRFIKGTMAPTRRGPLSSA
jgi:hypothetical protein